MQRPPPGVVVAAACAGGALLLAWAALRRHTKGAPPVEDPLPLSPTRSKGRRVSFSDIQNDIPRPADGAGARDTAPVVAAADAGRQAPAEAGGGEILRTVDEERDTARPARYVSPPPARSPPPSAAAAAVAAADAGRQTAGSGKQGGDQEEEEEYEVWSKEQTDVYTSAGGRGASPPSPAAKAPPLLRVTLRAR